MKIKTTYRLLSGDEIFTETETTLERAYANIDAMVQKPFMRVARLDGKMVIVNTSQVQYITIEEL